MKKTLKIAGIITASLVLFMLLIPFAFKGTIVKKIEKEINKNVNAVVSFDGIGLSLFRNFPNLNVKISDLKIVGKDEFALDTLANISSLSLAIDIMSVFKGSEYKVNKIILSTPRIKLKVLADGKANWEITFPSTDTVSKEPSVFKIYLDEIRISNGLFVYDDAEIPTMMQFEDLNGKLSGDMTADITKLKIDATVENVVADYDGIRYLSKTKAKVKTILDSDLANWIFTFKNGNLTLNDLSLNADGYFAMPEEGYKMDIKFAAQENSFKAFLSMIPLVYAKDFDKITASGTMAFDGYVKGLYSDISMPAFGINLKINNGSFSYPDLPGKVTDVNVQASVINQDGVLDNTIVEVPKMHLKIANNPLDATFAMRNPITDPDIKATLKGVLNLADVSKIYPLDANSSLQGMVSSDIAIAGKISAIEKKDFDKFYAKGYAVIENVNYSGKEVEHTVEISKARLDFNPSYFELSKMDVKIGKNDIAANGRLENYIPWFFKKNSVLNGSLTTVSKYMDINSLVKTSTPSSQEESGEPLTIIQVPADMNIAVNTTFDRIIYDTYDMQNMKGSVLIANRTILLKELNFDMLGGSMQLAGSYNTLDPQKPQVDLDIKLKKVNIRETFNAFNTMQKLAPFASHLSGDISTNLKFKGPLKQDMMPDLSNVSAYGLVLSDLLGISGTHALTTIAEILKIEKLKNPAIENLNLSFDIIDGKATIKPMDFKLGNYKANFSGSTGLDQILNLILTLDIPRSEFGTKANGVLNGMLNDASKKGINVNLGEIIPVTILIGGTVTSPKISAGIKAAMADMAADLKKQALEQVEKKKEEIISKAKDEAEKLLAEADAKAAKLLSEADQQGQRIIDLANQAANKVRKVSDSTANKLVAEGNKNGPIAALAAKKAAEKVRKEGEQKAQNLINEAQQQKDAIIRKAQLESNKVKQEAINKIEKK